MVRPGDTVICEDCGRTYVLTPDDDYYVRNTDGKSVCLECLIQPIPLAEVRELPADDVQIAWPVGEYDFHCTACAHREAWNTIEASRAAAVWHVYSQHRELFFQLAGEQRPPQDPRPETLGRQLEPWEVQGW